MAGAHYVFYTNRPELFAVTVASSIVTSDHLAVYVNCCLNETNNQDLQANHKKKVKCYCRDNSSMQRLTCFLDNYSWRALINCMEHDVISVDEAFSDFVNVLQFVLDNVVGFRLVTLRSNEPPYITPYIKFLLNKRNKLMRCGRTVQADILTRDIGERIAKARAKGHNITDF